MKLLEPYKVTLYNFNKPTPYAFVDHKLKIVAINTHPSIKRWRRVLAFIHELLHIHDRVYKVITPHYKLHLEAIAILLFISLKEEKSCDFQSFLNFLFKFKDPFITQKLIDTITPYIIKITDEIYGRKI